MNHDWTHQRALNIAEEVALWIDGKKTSSEFGVKWAVSEEQPDRSARTLYSGSAGIVVFLLELYKATGSQAAYDDAVAGGRDLVIYVRKQTSLPCAMFSGWGGYAFTFVELFKGTGDREFKDAAELCLQKLTSQSSEIGGGRGWLEEMPFSDITGFKGEREIYDASVGAAGAGMVYLYALEHQVYFEGLEIARAVGDRLIEVGEPMDVGTQWGLMNDMPFQFTAPNFAHGGAGVAYFLARLYEHTQDKRYLEAAISGAQHLQDIAFSSGDGQLICHQKEGKNPQEHFYLGQCHGPAGTSRLFYVLHRITGDAQWLEFSHSLLLGLQATGAPEQRSFGMWNNVSQCCCDAGIGDYALFMYEASQDEAYLNLSLRVAAELERRAVTDDAGSRWPQAEHRARPDFVETQTGYMQGAAGVGSFFLHLAGVLGGKQAKIAFADSPFTVSQTD